MLKTLNLKASIEGKEILKGIGLEVQPGELHVLMGPNGSGKSTLAQVLAGSSQFTVHSGRIVFGGKDIKKLTPDKRAKLGIFLAFQHPVEIQGVSVFNVLRKAKQSANGKQMRTATKRHTSVTPLYNRITSSNGFDARAFREDLINYLAELRLSADFLSRSLNDGFSGGEKKRSEILQMMALKPKLVILDEIDSGLDVDGLKIVAQAIKKFSTLNSQSSILLITHYARILKYLKPDFVHIMVDGKIIKSGKANLAREIEEKGYQNIGKEVQYA